jgi:hypothetical protein
MYKKRLDKWRFHKNLREDDMLFALQTLSELSSNIWSANFEIHDTLVDEDEIRRYWKRRPSPTSDKLRDNLSQPAHIRVTLVKRDNNTNNDSAKTVRDRHRSNSMRSGYRKKDLRRKVPSYRSIANQTTGRSSRIYYGVLDRQYVALKCLKTYFDGTFFVAPNVRPIDHKGVRPWRDGVAWTSEGPVLLQRPYADLLAPGSLINSLTSFLELHESDQFDAARATLDRLYALLEVLVKQQHPTLFSAILLLMQMLQQNRLPDLLTFILNRLCVDASVHFGEGHCLSLAFASLTWMTSDDIAEEGLEVIARLFAQRTPAGQKHGQYLTSTLYRVWCLYVKGSVERANDSLCRLAESCFDAGLDDHDHLLRSVLHLSSIIDITMGNGAAARQKLHTLVSALDRHRDTYRNLTASDALTKNHLMIYEQELTAARFEYLDLLSHTHCSPGDILASPGSSLGEDCMARIWSSQVMGLTLARRRTFHQSRY